MFVGRRETADPLVKRLSMYVTVSRLKCADSSSPLRQKMMSYSPAKKLINHSSDNGNETMSLCRKVIVKLTVPKIIVNLSKMILSAVIS